MRIPRVTYCRVRCYERLTHLSGKHLSYLTQLCCFLLQAPTPAPLLSFAIPRVEQVNSIWWKQRVARSRYSAHIANCELCVVLSTLDIYPLVKDAQDVGWCRPFVW